MPPEYFNSLDYLAQRRYSEKLRIDDEVLPDPYSIEEDLWADDITQWPDLQFGDIYSYLIHTEGPYTQEKLKAYKSLESYNYFTSGHVRTVYCYRCKEYIIFKSQPKDPRQSLHGLDSFTER